MPRQITGAKIFLAGGQTIQVGSAPVAEFVNIMEQRPEGVRRIQIMDGNEIMVHWTHIVAVQIFSAGK